MEEVEQKNVKKIGEFRKMFQSEYIYKLEKKNEPQLKPYTENKPAIETIKPRK